MFSARETADAVRDPIVRFTVAIPRSDLTAIEREVFRRQDREGRGAASRDSLIREAVRSHLQQLAEARLAGTGRPR